MGQSLPFTQDTWLSLHLVFPHGLLWLGESSCSAESCCVLVVYVVFLFCFVLV